MAAERLAEQPSLGRQRLELVPSRYRFWSLRGFPYVLVYDAEVTPILVVRVLHMSRDLPAQLGELLH